MATLEFNKAELFTVPLSCCILLYAWVNSSLSSYVGICFVPDTNRGPLRTKSPPFTQQVLVTRQVPPALGGTSRHPCPHATHAFHTQGQGGALLTCPSPFSLCFREPPELEEAFPRFLQSSDGVWSV